MAETKDILAKYKNIALVGASKDLKKTSSIVMKYLQNNGYKVYPVNPTISCLLYTSPSPRDREKSRMPSSA